MEFKADLCASGTSAISKSQDVKYNEDDTFPPNFLTFVVSRLRRKFCSLDNPDREIGISNYHKANLLEGCMEKSVCDRVFEESMNRNRKCLCDTVRPVLWLSQVTGLVPLCIHHEKNLEGAGERTGSCEVIYRRTSFGSLVNILLLCCFLPLTPVVYWEIRNRMAQIFDGTDLYAFTFQTMAMFVETLILLIAGRVYKHRFTKGWSILTDVYHALCDSAEDLGKITAGSYAAALIVVVEGSILLVFNVWTTVKSVGIYQGCIDIYIGSFLVHLTTFIPYVFSTLFFFICLLLRTHFMKITEMLRTTVINKHKSGIATRVDALRILHEQLCTAVRYFEEFFGIQILLTLCTGCFTVTTGAYALILKGEGISSSKGEEIAWGLQLYSATVFILLILIAGQLVTNSGASAAEVLNAVPLSELDKKTQVQIKAFLHKIAAFPATIRAVNITSISTTFLASAATNITTYLLVLMQFKLSIENRVPFYHNISGSGINIHASGAVLANSSFEVDENATGVRNEFWQ